MSNPESPLLFRSHRGSLDDSMQSVIEINSFEHLSSVIEEEWKNWYVRVIHIKWEEYVYDKRINWDTYIVSCTVELSNDVVSTFPVGYLNRDPRWIHE